MSNALAQSSSSKSICPSPSLSTSSLQSVSPKPTSTVPVAHWIFFVSPSIIVIVCPVVASSNRIGFVGSVSSHAGSSASIIHPHHCLLHHYRHRQMRQVLHYCPFRSYIQGRPGQSNHHHHHRSHCHMRCFARGRQLHLYNADHRHRLEV